jgi:hypothetical protein
MLLPREKPFLNGLNSYYLDIEKFIQHLQGEIGTGCLYGHGAEMELLVYFDESEIVRGITQHKGDPALASSHIEHVLAALAHRSFQIAVYYLDADSIFFWGQLPAFKRAKDALPSTRVTLPDLIFRLNKKNFSGFIEVETEARPHCAILFFHQGQRRGGSYYWSRGGLSIADDDYNTLLGLLQKSKGSYRLGYFTGEPAEVPTDSLMPDKVEEAVLRPARQPTEVDNAVNEFLAIFLNVVGSKTGSELLIDLKLKFIDFVSIYPVLDPYKNFCTLNDNGTVIFADERSARDGAEGIVDCAWMVAEEYKMRKKFQAALKKMVGKDVLRAQGIEVERK